MSPTLAAFVLNVAAAAGVWWAARAARGFFELDEPLPAVLGAFDRGSPVTFAPPGGTGMTAAECLGGMPVAYPVGNFTSAAAAMKFTVSYANT